MTQEEFGFLLARKLRIHYWIFDVPRDGALIPIGKQLFGEFHWLNATDVVYCKNIMRLKSDLPQEHWQLWVKLLLAYNDLASLPYRAHNNKELNNMRHLEQAVQLHRSCVTKHILPLRDATGLRFHNELIPHVEYIIASIEQAEDQLALERLPRVIVALETALTNFHEITQITQPPEQLVTHA